jgi:hypothetical protein
MTTWGDLRTTIRGELSDTGDTPRWTDALLFTYVCDAVRDYSLWFPKRTDRLELTLAEGSYALPADFVDALFVECPRDTYLEARKPRPGVRFPSQGGSKPFYYFIEGGNLYLPGTPVDGAEILLTYNAIHAVPATAADSAFLFTVPLLDEELIRLYVRAQANGQMRNRQSLLDRFKTRASGGNDRQDNPLEPEVESLMLEYKLKVAQRVDGGAVLLFRPGRVR